MRSSGFVWFWLAWSRLAERCWDVPLFDPRNGTLIIRGRTIITRRKHKDAWKDLKKFGACVRGGRADVLIGRDKADVLRINEQRYGCGGLEILSGPERNEMREFWLEISMDTETRESKGG